MKYHFLSRDVLKLIAIVSMLLDHVGKLFFPKILILQIIGRLAFPIFAFFIAEGFYYTRNKLKYFINILIFAVIAQVPYSFLWGGLNILFTFACSLLLMFIWNLTAKLDKLESMILKIVLLLIIVVVCGFALITDMSYRWYGILLPFAFYIFRKNQVVKFLIFTCLTVGFVLEHILWLDKHVTFNNLMQLFSLFSIILLIFYNDTLKGNKKFKYLFYVFYPLHLVVLLVLTWL